MAGMHDALIAVGLGPDRIHTELFGARPSINPGLTGQTRRPPHQPPGPPATGPLVTFARSGISTPFPGSTHSVLDLADACDVPTRWSCRTGVCHTCTTPLLSGDISYSPSAAGTSRRTEKCSSAAPSPAPTSSWTCSGPAGRETGLSWPPSGGPG